MTGRRMYEIERKVFYKHIESIMKILEPCKDTHVIFEIGREMGYLHNDLIEELDKELAPELQENKVNYEHFEESENPNTWQKNTDDSGIREEMKRNISEQEGEV